MRSKPVHATATLTTQAELASAACEAMLALAHAAEKTVTAAA